MDVKEEELLGGSVGNHWYYRSKQLALDAMLHGVAFRRILDIGAGSAIFSRHLLEKGAEFGCVRGFRPTRPIARNCSPASQFDLSAASSRVTPISCC